MPSPENEKTLAEFLSDFNALYDNDLELLSSFTAERHLYIENYFKQYSLEALNQCIESEGPFPCSTTVTNEDEFSTLAFTVSFIKGESANRRRYIVVGGQFGKRDVDIFYFKQFLDHDIHIFYWC